MTGRLQNEIKQTKPFASLEEEVLLNLMRTTDSLERQLSASLRPFGLSTTQYNVLRILRGAGQSGLQCGEIADRMITRDPDITRLLDRLEKRNLIERCRDTRDRRVITARIAPEGLRILQEIDGSHPKLLKSMLGHMSASDLKALCSLLEQARAQEQ
jgi:DNA-binding MarR family transcriptional regulator